MSTRIPVTHCLTADRSHTLCGRPYWDNCGIRISTPARGRVDCQRCVRAIERLEYSAQLVAESQARLAARQAEMEAAAKAKVEADFPDGFFARGPFDQADADLAESKRVIRETFARAAERATRSCAAHLDCGNTAVPVADLSFRGFCPSCERVALGGDTGYYRIHAEHDASQQQVVRLCDYHLRLAESCGMVDARNVPAIESECFCTTCHICD